MPQFVQDIFDLGLKKEFTQEEKSHPLRRLQSITLSIPPLSFPDNYEQLCVGIVSLLSQSPLEAFHFYPTSRWHLDKDDGGGASMASESLWDKLIHNHAKTLRRVSIYQITITSKTLTMICESCMKLEDLFVVVWPGFTVSSYSTFPSSRFHANNINREHWSRLSPYPRPSGRSI